MKPISESHFLPVAIIALGTAAVIVGAVMIALREQQRQSLEDNNNQLADTAEVDTSASDISVANEVLSEAAEQSEPVYVPSDDQRADPTLEEASRDRWSRGYRMDGIPAGIFGA